MVLPWHALVRHFFLCCRFSRGLQLAPGLLDPLDGPCVWRLSARRLLFLHRDLLPPLVLHLKHSVAALRGDLLSGIGNAGRFYFWSAPRQCLQQRLAVLQLRGGSTARASSIAGRGEGDDRGGSKEGALQLQFRVECGEEPIICQNARPLASLLPHVWRS